MAEEKQIQEVTKFEIDLKDLAVEAYTKAFMAYRISLENWFLLNELLAYVKNEKLTSKEIQTRLGRLFGVVNSEILKEFVKLDRLSKKTATISAQSNPEKSSSEEKTEEKGNNE
jgi:hypothetical protein